MKQEEAKPTFDKIAIIGTGNVGATKAYTLMLDGMIPEIVLIDANQKKAEGEAMDLNHGMAFVKPAVIRATADYAAVSGCDIVIITAGASQKPDETRLQLLSRNISIFSSIINSVLSYNQTCIFLVVTNPVDILTYATYRLSGFPKERVIGSGTVLDTGRLRYVIGSHLSVDTRNVHSYIIGEHGDSELACWSLANIAGVPFDHFCRQCALCSDHKKCKTDFFEQVKNAAYHIIDRKGATYYAVALSVRRIVEAIVRNERAILTVSSYLSGGPGEQNLKEICLSLPAVVGRGGIEQIVDLPLSREEYQKLGQSAEILKAQQAELTF